MPKYKLIDWDTACALYDCGLREIACVAVPFGTDCMELAVRYAEREAWEPYWMESWLRGEASNAITTWTYCVQVE